MFSVDVNYNTTITKAAFFLALRKLIYLEKKTPEATADVSERVVIDDEMLKRCPGIDRLRADTREKLKTYLQEQVSFTRQSFVNINRSFSY